jgi:hypothetical protein
MSFSEPDPTANRKEQTSRAHELASEADIAGADSAPTGQQEQAAQSTREMEVTLAVEAVAQAALETKDPWLFGAVARELARRQPITPWSRTRDWLYARLFDTQRLLQEFGRHPPSRASADDVRDTLTVRRIIKATLVALIRGDRVGLAALNRAAAKVLKSSIDGAATPDEQRLARRPRAAVLKTEDGQRGVLEYGDVPEHDSFSRALGVRALGDERIELTKEALDAHKFEILQRPSLSEGRGATAEFYAAHLHLVHQFSKADEFVDRLVGRGWERRPSSESPPGAFLRWHEDPGLFPVPSVMHLIATKIDEAAVAHGDTPLFPRRRAGGFDLAPEFETQRSALRDGVRRWQLDLEERRVVPDSDDFRALVRLGLRALGADGRVVDNLFKASMAKVTRSKQASEEADASDAVVTGT